MFAFGYSFNSIIDENNKNIINLVQTTNLEKELNFELKFNNSQNKEVSLYSQTDLYLENELELWQLKVEESVIFEIHSNKATIYYEVLNSLNQEKLSYWLLHTLMPIYLTIVNQKYFLHSAAFEIDDFAYLILGQSFNGKSTFMDHAIQQGRDFLSDDKIMIVKSNHDFLIQSSYNYCRPSRELESLGYKVENFTKEAKKLGHCYYFKPVEPNEKIEFRVISGIEKFKILKECSDMELGLNVKQRFEFISKLANHTTLYEVAVPWDLNRLPEVYSEIMNHIKEFRHA